MDHMDPDDDNYLPIVVRRYHDKEASVTGHEGSTTPFEILLICLVVPVSLYLHQAIVIAATGGSSFDCHQQQQQRRRDVAVEFTTLILTMLLVQTSLLPYIIGPCLLLLGMVVVAAVCKNNTSCQVTVAQVQEEEDITLLLLPRDIFGRITPVTKKKKNNEDFAEVNDEVNATPKQTRIRSSKPSKTTMTTVVDKTTLTRDVFGRIKYNINKESSSSSSSNEDATKTINKQEESAATAAAIAQLTHNNHYHTNVTHTNRPIYLSAHRAYVYLLTTIAILAVDFPLFPRRYCKTEVLGYGLMDLGAASFVIVAGWTSVIQNHQYHQSTINSSGSSNNRGGGGGGTTTITQPNYYYYKVVKKCTPLLLIGLIRLATTKRLEYQEHVSEYGIHWNFFFTLCCIELVMILWKQVKATLLLFINRYVLRPPPTTATATAATCISMDLVLGVALIVSYQLYLSQYGGQEYIVYANRQCFDSNNSLCNAFAANREGILGIIGYCSLRLLSEFIAKLCLLPLPSSSSSNANDSTQRRLIFYTSMGLWLLHSLLTVGLHIPNSRRSTNASFVLWALAHNTSLLTCIHGVVATRYDVVDKKCNTNNNLSLPWILSSVNDFGLAVFLSSNVLTGIVNLTFDTLHSSNNKAMLILSVYLALVCGFALFLDTLFKRRREKVD